LNPNTVRRSTTACISNRLKLVLKYP